MLRSHNSLMPCKAALGSGQTMTACPRQNDALGFTLLEVLIVLVMIGILTTMAGSVLLPGFEQRRLRSHMEILADQIAFAQHRAILSGRPYGLVVEDESYMFVTYSDQQWQPAYEASIQGDMLESLQLNNQQGLRIPTILSTKQDNTDKGIEALQPSVIFSPIGEPLPLDLIVADAGEGWRLFRDIDDVIKLSRWLFNDE